MYKYAFVRLLVIVLQLSRNSDEYQMAVSLVQKLNLSLALFKVQRHRLKQLRRNVPVFM